MKKTIIMFILLLVVSSCQSHIKDFNDMNLDMQDSIEQNRMQKLMEDAKYNEDILLFDKNEFFLNVGDEKTIYSLIKNTESESNIVSLSLIDCETVNGDECVVSADFLNDVEIPAQSMKIIPIKFNGLTAGMSKLTFEVSYKQESIIKKILVVNVG